MADAPIQRWSHTKAKPSPCSDGSMEPTHSNMQRLAMERDEWKETAMKALALAGRLIMERRR